MLLSMADVAGPMGKGTGEDGNHMEANSVCRVSESEDLLHESGNTLNESGGP